METCNYLIGKASGKEYRCDLSANHDGPHVVHLDEPIILSDGQWFAGGPAGCIIKSQGQPLPKCKRVFGHHYICSCHLNIGHEGPHMIYADEAILLGDGFGNPPTFIVGQRPKGSWNPLSRSMQE